MPLKLTNTFAPLVLISTLAAGLSACGGGGSSGSVNATPGPASFPVQQAMAYAFTHGMQATLTISGTTSNGSISYPVTGTLTYALGIASNATFEGAAALQANETLNATISANGTSQPLAVNGAMFLNQQYVPVGEKTSDSYCVATTSPNFPATASAGRSGDIATLNCYADSSKLNLINVEKLSYVAAAASDGSSLDLQLVTTDYGLSSTPQSTNSVTYTISASGVPKLTRVQISGTESGYTVTLDAK